MGWVQGQMHLEWEKMLTELNDDGNDDSTCFNQIVFVHFYKKN